MKRIDCLKESVIHKRPNKIALESLWIFKMVIEDRRPSTAKKNLWEDFTVITWQLQYVWPYLQVFYNYYKMALTLIEDTVLCSNTEKYASLQDILQDLGNRKLCSFNL